MKIIIKKQTGFTLIELMIAVAIIGVLAAIAIPQYQTYVIKAKLTEALVVAKPLRMILEDYYYEKGVPLANIGGPADNGNILGAVGAGLPQDGTATAYWDDYKTDIIQNAYVSQGYVFIKLQSGGAGGLPESLNNKWIFLVPQYTDIANSKGDLVWQCGTFGVPFKYLPTHCRNLGADVRRL